MAECSDPRKSPMQIEQCYTKCQHNIDSADQHVQFTVNSFQRKFCLFVCNASDRYEYNTMQM